MQLLCPLVTTVNVSGLLGDVGCCLVPGSMDSLRRCGGLKQTLMSYNQYGEPHQHHKQGHPAGRHRVHSLPGSWLCRPLHPHSLQGRTLGGYQSTSCPGLESHGFPCVFDHCIAVLFTICHHGLTSQSPEEKSPLGHGNRWKQ